MDKVEKISEELKIMDINGREVDRDVVDQLKQSKFGKMVKGKYVSKENDPYYRRFDFWVNKKQDKPILMKKEVFEGADGVGTSWGNTFEVCEWPFQEVSSLDA